MKRLSSIRQQLLGMGVILFVTALLIPQAANADVDAAAYYRLRCASCHGPNGEGTKDKAPALAPALKGNQLVVNAPAQTIAHIIRHGRGGQQRVYDKFPNMPEFGPVMVPDVEGLVHYLKTDLQQSEDNSLLP